MVEMRRVAHRELVKWTRRVLEQASVPEPIAAIEAEVMVEADLYGVPSHGVRMLPGLILGIREGRIHGHPEVRLVKERAATCMLDGDLGPGRFVAMQGMRQAVDRCRNFGMGSCLALRTSHWGRAYHYAARAAAQGVIGICTTNAITNMVAWESSELLLGNNPLAIGIPTLPGEPPLVLDMAMSQAALGKVATWKREGKKAPSGWGLDSEGRPTEDPRAILSSRKLLPFGGHKGAGLAMMMELLTAALAGSWFSHEIITRDASGLDPGSSKLFLALDPEAFAGREILLRRVGELVEWLRARGGPAAEVVLPGERGWATRASYLEQGIPIHPEIAAQLESLTIPIPWA